jgi:CelD/BcsL family acetyltransferase involved in cellulose biosynthesis
MVEYGTSFARFETRSRHGVDQAMPAIPFPLLRQPAFRQTVGSPQRVTLDVGASPFRQAVGVGGTAGRTGHDTGVRFSVIRDRAGFDALEHEWNDLFERCGRSVQAFQSFNWLWHWANHYLTPERPGRPGGMSLAIVVGRRDGRLVLVWPLISERRAGLNILSWMGAPVSQYGDVLAEHGAMGEAAIRASWRYIERELAPDLVRLRKVRADAIVAPCLREAGSRTSDRQVAPYIDLTSAPDYATYELRHSARLRRNRRRHRRRLEERGPVALETHKDGSQAAALAVFGLALKRAWIAARGLVSPALADRRMERFMADVAEAASHPAGCRVSALTAAGTAAAVEIALECKGRRLVHVIVYDLAFDKTGAGNLLLEESIRAAKADAIEVFDFMAPGDAYKFEWADDAVAVDDHTLGLSAVGKISASVYPGVVRGGLKRAFAALPAGLRRVLAATIGGRAALT